MYSTESTVPICAAVNIHYASITDLTWHNDKYLIITSSDGFCSVVCFAPKQFGERFNVSELPLKLQKLFENYDKISMCSMQSHEVQCANVKSTMLKTAKNKDVKLEVLSTLEDKKPMAPDK